VSRIPFLRGYDFNLGFFRKIRAWWRPESDPAAFAEARQLRENMRIQRMGASGRTPLHGRESDYRKR
jgi:hypothetical protein